MDFHASDHPTIIYADRYSACPKWILILLFDEGKRGDLAQKQLGKTNSAIQSKWIMHKYNKILVFWYSVVNIWLVVVRT